MSSNVDRYESLKHFLKEDIRKFKERLNHPLQSVLWVCVGILLTLMFYGLKISLDLSDIKILLLTKSGCKIESQNE